MQAPEGAGELGNWGLLINSLTNRSQNQELLEQLSREQRFDPAGGSYVLENNDRHYEIIFSPLNGVNEGAAYWVILDDISGHLFNIRQSLVSYLLMGAGGILTALVLLSLLLQKPIRFFSLLSTELSQLSRSEFSEFRQTLGDYYNREKIFGQDERDLLVHSAMQLSEQLEHLEDEVAERTDSLEKSRLALTKERDFLFGLLETAPLVIITQNRKGRPAQCKSLWFASDGLGWRLSA